MENKTESVITYSDLEALKQRMVDLQGIKQAVENQVSEILQSNQISKRGLARVIESLVSYPSPPKRKLTDEYEIAIHRLLMEVKQVQLTMLMISVELSKHDEVNSTESTTENTGE